MPLRLPVRSLEPAELDARLERGDRRHGALFYRPSCDGCQACEAIRLDLSRFVPSKTHRRILKRGDRALRVVRAEPISDAERVRLYDRHRFGRGLAREDATPMDEVGYQRFLVDRYCDSFELQYWSEGRLVGVAITDRGDEALSAVYCFYDPDFASLSIGTYSILKLTELARGMGMRHLYLGLHIEGCDAMAYKARYRPHERRVAGTWTEFM